MATPETGSTQSTSETPAPLTEVLREWVNERAAANAADLTELADFLERNPGLANDPRITAKIGRTAAVAEVLRDAQAVLGTAILDEQGMLDTVQAMFPESTQPSTTED